MRLSEVNERLMVEDYLYCISIISLISIINLKCNIHKLARSDKHFRISVNGKVLILVYMQLVCFVLICVFRIKSIGATEAT